MLAYSGRGRFVVEPLDLNALLHEMLVLLYASIPKSQHTARVKTQRLAPQPEPVGLDTIGWLTLNPPASPLATLAWYLAAILRAAFSRRFGRADRRYQPDRVHTWRYSEGY
jgi:hypothetical protein